MRCARIILSVSLTVVLAACSAASNSTSAGGPSAKPLHLRLATLTGRQRSVADDTGRVRVVNIWATWCPPCIGELPEFQAAARATGVEFIGVDQGEDAKRVARAVRAAGVTYLILLDQGQDFGANYATIGLPTTLILGKDDRVLVTHEGAYDAADLRRDIAQAVK